MFAFLEFNGERFVQFGNNMLIIAGAFLVGYIFGWFMIWQADRWIFRRHLPGQFYQVARLVTGILFAILMAIILFGHGSGWTLFGGGGEGNDNGETDKTGTAVEGEKSPGTIDSTSPKVEVPVAEETPADIDTPNRIEITLLGGSDVKESKFYLIGDDTQPKTFTEVKDAMAGKAGNSKEPLAVVIRFRAHNRLASDHVAVIQLRDWAGPKGKGYTIIMPSR